jgi:rhodanese-related sulfurtransferase
VLQLTPTQLQHHLQTATPKPVLLDVREPSEFEFCALEGAINIPLTRISEAAATLDPEQEYVLICHHGMRSQRAGALLAAHGFEKLINLVGGVEAWACDLAPDMPRY